MMKHFTTILLFFFIVNVHAQKSDEEVITGAESTNDYFHLLEGKRIGILTNHTGIIGNKHLVDSLFEAGFDIRYIFAPEHGFRGNADAGEAVNDTIDRATGIPVYSLYKSKTGKPETKTMQGLDVIVFDIQDVGLRFYTYYISMYKMMAACAESEKTMIVLDRPNPNGFYIDGPILDMKYKSGVGYLPIPVVHGMTLGELALMINGEAWLPNHKQCDLKVITCKNYTHQTRYTLPIPPSPNLPNMKSIYLYPSVCLFEGTPVSLGRGTEMPFQVFGSPGMKSYSFAFTPRSMPGAKNPPLLNQTCYGRDLRTIPDEQIGDEKLNLSYLIEAYKALDMGDKFFRPFFEKLIGVDYVRTMIKQGKTNEEIRAVWEADVVRFAEQRRPYLLYEE